MLFSRYVSVSSLASSCRALRHSFEAGLNIVDVFRQQSIRGTRELRPLTGRVADQLDRGKSLTSALRKETTLPPLFLALVEVGEESGHLAEIFGTLEEYYTLQQQIQRRFRTGIMLPMIQFVFAVLIIAAVIWILGALTGGKQGVFGLSGSSGALVFVGVVFGLVLLVVLGGRLLLANLRGKYVMDALILKLPLIGSCAQALAMARFTLALHMTLESGMLLHRAMRMSLEASGNAAFEAQAKPITAELRQGEDLSLAITGAWIFPAEFRHILGVAEESGRIPEVMKQQCRYYQEEGERKLKALMQVAAWLVWLVYALFAIIMIFNLAGIYFSALQLK